MRFYKNELLIGKDNVERLKNKKVLIIGCGGVGGFAAEAIARSGIFNITITDNDIIDITNLNRQIISLSSNIGKYKVDVLYDRIKDINPSCNVIKIKEFINSENLKDIITKDFDYVIDAIDSMTSKIDLIEYCYNNDIKIISSMGMGNKLSPENIIIDDIYKTKYCPMAKIIRKELRKRDIKHLTVCYSKNEVNKRYKEPSSMIFAPSVCGINMAYKVINDLIEI
ncbi:tRNA threonylcarbamoyladenosine dehydratase [uncultured Anaerofustis sp.]|uniref:tRNA threonylcarbamoyladenosine dehydratase n=1 Tax=uncultured Anaerofustis sp. TaxID=904996 RepID=UPI0025DB4F4A|nr:tRNA threonylcarbamoyladenosine dehydratase [uncultured Anaerofustis sp.]